MADNTQLNVGAGGDTIRDLARQSGAVKTQVFQIDIGGAGANAEVLVTAGRQLMSASLPVTLASDQPALTTVNASGSSVWGQALSLVATATATIASANSTPAGYQIKGLLCHGTGDGYFFLQVNGSTVASGRTRSTAPMLQIVFSNGIAVSTGATVATKVTNESGSTADYEATLLGN